MPDQARVVCFYAVIIGAALGPAVLAILIVRYLQGWTRRLAVPVLLLGLLGAACAVLVPELHKADSSASPDAGGFVILGMFMLMAIAAISAAIGFAIGVFLLYRHRRQSQAGRMFWMNRSPR